MGRDLRAQSPYLIAGLGGFLFGIAAVHHATEFTAVGQWTGPTVALLLDGLPALGLVYAGYWLTGTDLSPDDRWRIWLWCLAGSALFVTVMALSIVIRALEGRPVGEAILPLLIAPEAGGIAGVVAGYQTARARMEARRARTTSDELRRQRKRLELALSGTDTALVELNLETDAVTWSETFVELVGQEPATVGEWYAMIHPDDRDCVRRELETMIETGGTWTGEFRVVDDGTTRWVGTRATPVHADDGTPARVLATATDISARKARERKLSEERERFRLLLESVDEYAFLVVDEDCTIRTWSDSARELFGYDAETAVGMSTAALHPESDCESDLPERLLQQARIAGESTHEGRRVRADGSEFHAEVRYTPLKTDDGALRGFAKIVRDLTDRRRQRRRTERFVEESNEVVMITDPDGTITYASGSADRVLDYGSDDIVGENVFDYLHPDDRNDAMETFYAGLEDPEGNLRIECRFESGTGEWLDVEGRYRNMLDDSAIDGILLYLRESAS